MNHFLSTSDWSQGDLESLLNLAAELKENPLNSSLKGRSIALLFLNPVAIVGAIWIVNIRNVRIAAFPFLGLFALILGGEKQGNILQ